MNRNFAIFAACLLGPAVPASARVEPIVIVPGRVITSTSFTPAADAPALAPFVGDDIPIVTQTPGDRRCRVLGKMTTSARMLNLLSGRPTHGDVDGALRRMAMRHGADLLTDVRYITHRQGLVEGGKIEGHATALACGN